MIGKTIIEGMDEKSYPETMIAESVATYTNIFKTGSVVIEI